MQLLRSILRGERVITHVLSHKEAVNAKIDNLIVVIRLLERRGIALEIHM